MSITSINDASTVGALVDDWVRPDEGRVSHRIYTDPNIFDAEMARIWRTTWLYAGHESEVENPGDYVNRTVGTVPIIITRTEAGNVEVFLNLCGHRGNTICHHESGTARTFKCAYHGWTYRNDGQLVAVPYPRSYGSEFDSSSMPLRRPARVANYRGLIFVSHSPGTESIEEHLGNVKPSIDRFLDISPTGRVRMSVGSHKIALNCNWKIFQENGSDNYHANFTHLSAFTNEAQRRIAAQVSRDASKAVVNLFEHGSTELDFRPEQRAQGAVLITGNATTGVSSEAVQRHIDALKARLGDEEGETLYREGPPLIYLYPNALIIQQDIRRLEPVSVDKSELFMYPAMLEGVDEEINDLRVSRHEAAYGPAGFILTDDLEIMARNYRAVKGAPTSG